MKTPLNLNRLFDPRHVAVLGVSRDERAMSARYVRGLVAEGFAGQVSCLARSAGKLHGATAYSSVDALPADVDVAVSLLPFATAPAAITAMAGRGAAFAVVYTAGFAEAGPDGRTAEVEMVARCNAAGMRVIGPNSMGVFSGPAALNLVPYQGIPRGRIALLSQSGNVALTLWESARATGVGFSRFVGFGNQADVALPELVRGLGEDAETDVIIIYLEGLRPHDGRAFVEACREVMPVKPIVALKGGRTVAGSRAASSHTAALTSEARAFHGLFDQAGVIEVHHLEHLLPVAESLRRCPPLGQGGVAAIGSGGGHSTIVADELENAGLSVPEFSDELQQGISALLPAYAPVTNPVDMTGAFTQDPSLFNSISAMALATDPGLAGVVCFGLWGLWDGGDVSPDSPFSYVEAAPLLGETQRRSGKPIIFYNPYANIPHPSLSGLREGGIPCYDSIEITAVAMAALRSRAEHLRRAVENREDWIVRPTAHVALENAPDELGRQAATVLDEAESMRFLTDHGVAVAPYCVAASVSDIAAAVRDLGLPVVVKALLPGVSHKSQYGAVRVGIATESEAIAVGDDMHQRLWSSDEGNCLAGFLISADLGRHRELIVGVKRDPVFGYTFMIGVGGVHAEVLDDVAVGVIECDVPAVAAAILRLRAPGYLCGGSNLEATARPLSNLIEKIIIGMDQRPEIDVVEINPLFVIDGEPVAADAAVHVRRASSAP